MSKSLFVLIGVLFSIQIFAQTGIGTTSPNASAKLDVFSETKGFLPPRVALTSTSAFSPITGLSDASALLTAAGLLVYNTATAGSAPSNVTPGYYYWNGTSWIRLIVPTDNAANVTGTVAVANGGTGLSALGTGIATFLGTPTSANLASAVTNETGSGALVFGTSPTISLPIITSGSEQFPQSIFVSPSTHATSKRAAIWLDGWSILQDVLGNGTKNFSIGETISGPQYPPRLVIAQGNGNIGLGTNTPTARLNLVGGGIKIHNGFTNNTTRPSLTASTIGNYEIRGVGSIEGSTQEDAGNDGFLRLSAGGGTHSTAQSSIDLSGYSNQPEMNNNIVMRTAGLERLRINATGNVGIGTSSPGATLEIGSSNGSVPGSLILNPTTSGTGIEGAEINLRPAPNPTTPAAQTWVIDQVSNSNNPRLRIFPSVTGETRGLAISDNGNLGIGTPSPASRLHIQSSGLNSLYIESTAADNNGIVILNANTDQGWNNWFHEFMFFQRQGNNIGNIAARENLVAYNTSSDYRLKTDLKNYNGLELVNKVKTYDYSWKSDNSRMHGVMAHELSELLPYAVTGIKDAVDKEGKIIPQSVDYSKLTPILIKAIQEQDLKINEQQKQIDALIKRLEKVESKK